MNVSVHIENSNILRYRQPVNSFFNFFCIFYSCPLNYADSGNNVRCGPSPQHCPLRQQQTLISTAACRPICIDAIAKKAINPSLPILFSRIVSAIHSPEKSLLPSLAFELLPLSPHPTALPAILQSDSPLIHQFPT